MAEWIKAGAIWFSARLRMASLALLAVIALRAVASVLAPDAAPPPASAPIQAHNDSASQMLTTGDSSS